MILLRLRGQSPLTLLPFAAKRDNKSVRRPNISISRIDWLQVRAFKPAVPRNLCLIAGDGQLETQASRVANATRPGPQDAWRKVHLWVADLIGDVLTSRNNEESCAFIDCNPSFSVYTELALSAAERLIIPFSADGSSKRAVKAVLTLVYGVWRQQNYPLSEFVINNTQFRMRVPELYMYVGNRLTQMNNSSASAFKTVVEEIGDEIWGVWQTKPSAFCVHPSGAATPSNKRTFRAMFQHEVNDANTASVVSGVLGIPTSTLSAGKNFVAGRNITVNQSQLDKLHRLYNPRSASAKNTSAEAVMCIM